ncbi:hypothetical protein CBM2623_A10107 [Cupriavidus taiwanensis]|nr:hypothetical protein CBM2623_A10107 [Cupriavidus taiwanensis]
MRLLAPTSLPSIFGLRSDSAARDGCKAMKERFCQAVKQWLWTFAVRMFAPRTGNNRSATQKSQGEDRRRSAGKDHSYRQRRRVQGWRARGHYAEEGYGGLCGQRPR